MNCFQEFTENGEWELDHSEALQQYFYEDTHPDKPFPRVRFLIFLTRKVRYFLINIIAPAVCVISISLTVFCLPPDSGEKVSLAVTVLLAFSVFQLIIMENTPRTSDFTPVMCNALIQKPFLTNTCEVLRFYFQVLLFLFSAVMFACIMAMSATSVAASVLVLYFHHHHTASRPPKLVRFIFFKIFAPLLCLSDRVPNSNQIEPQSQKDDVITANENDVIAFEYVADDVKVRPRTPLVRDEGMRQVLGELRQMTGKFAEVEREGKVLAEWRAVAMVLDRLFFVLTLATMVGGLAVFLSRQDQTH